MGKTKNSSVRKIARQPKKWQKLFRYTLEREKAIKELAIFVHLLEDLAKRSTLSADSIHDTNGEKIYL